MGVVDVLMGGGARHRGQELFPERFPNHRLDAGEHFVGQVRKLPAFSFGELAAVSVDHADQPADVACGQVETASGMCFMMTAETGMTIPPGTRPLCASRW